MGNEIVELSNRIGLLLVIVALGIQSWMSIFLDVTSDTFYNAYTVLFSLSTILFITGSVLLATTNVTRLFAIYHRINYAIAVISLVGLSILLVFRTDFESLLFPRLTGIYFLIFDFLWIFVLGLILLKRFQKTANTANT